MEDVEVKTCSVFKGLRLSLAFVFAVALGLPSCTSVEYWDKGHLADPVMSYQDGGTQTHFDQKIFQSIEGSAGGFGANAGGGCGCN